MRKKREGGKKERKNKGRTMLECIHQNTSAHTHTHRRYTNVGHTPASQSVPADDGGRVDLELDKLLCMLQELSGHYHLQERAVQVDTSTRVLSQACTNFHPPFNLDKSVALWALESLVTFMRKAVGFQCVIIHVIDAGRSHFSNNCHAI